MNAWTHLQSVQFDHEREPKMWQVRLTTASPTPVELARIQMSRVKVEAVLVSVVAGLLIVNVRRAAAKAGTTEQASDKKRRA